jgi:hypothetical protein
MLGVWGRLSRYPEEAELYVRVGIIIAVVLVVQVYEIWDVEDSEMYA